MKIQFKILLSKVSLRSYSVNGWGRMEQWMRMAIMGTWNRIRVEDNFDNSHLSEHVAHYPAIN
jgi:hypothetical protein